MAWCVGGRRAELVYRPAILRAIHKAQDEKATAWRWLYTYRDGFSVDFWPTEPEYGEHLAQIAASFQRRLHGT